MIEKFLRMRYVFMVAAIVTFINSIFFLFIGVRNAFHGYHDVLTDHEHATPGLHFIESLDSFMVSLVFLIFALGIMRIFTHYHSDEKKFPEWLRISSFKELKVLLWETILVTLVILTVSKIVVDYNKLSWDILFLPGVTLLLSLSLFVMRKH